MYTRDSTHKPNKILPSGSAKDAVLSISLRCDAINEVRPHHAEADSHFNESPQKDKIYSRQQHTLQFCRIQYGHWSEQSKAVPGQAGLPLAFRSTGLL